MLWEGVLRLSRQHLGHLGFEEVKGFGIQAEGPLTCQGRALDTATAQEVLAPVADKATYHKPYILKFKQNLKH